MTTCGLQASNILPKIGFQYKEVHLLTKETALQVVHAMKCKTAGEISGKATESRERNKCLVHT